MDKLVYTWALFLARPKKTVHLLVQLLQGLIRRRPGAPNTGGEDPIPHAVLCESVKVLEFGQTECEDRPEERLIHATKECPQILRPLLHTALATYLRLSLAHKTLHRYRSLRAFQKDTPAVIAAIHGGVEILAPLPTRKTKKHAS